MDSQFIKFLNQCQKNRDTPNLLNDYKKVVIQELINGVDTENTMNDFYTLVSSDYIRDVIKYNNPLNIYYVTNVHKFLLKLHKLYEINVLDEIINNISDLTHCKSWNELFNTLFTLLSSTHVTINNAKFIKIETITCDDVNTFSDSDDNDDNDSE